MGGWDHDLGRKVLDMAKRTVYQRPDKKWGWRLTANNGAIIAVDGGQGYENEADCRTMADKVIGGEYKNAEKFRAPLPKKQ